MSVRLGPSLNNVLSRPSNARRSPHSDVWKEATPRSQAGDDAWKALEQFGRQLQGCEASDEQIRRFLETLRKCTPAEVVFWYSGSLREDIIFQGDFPVPEAWCRVFMQVQQVCRASEESHVVFLSPRSHFPATGPMPHSGLMVRLSKSRSVWAVALSFDASREFGPAHGKVLNLARRMLLAHRQQLRAQEKARDLMLDLVQSLAAAINAKDPYTRGHSERVARMAARLGQELSLRPSELGTLYLTGLLHDIGKIGIRSAVLQTTSPLSAEERAHIEQHPVIGDAILADVRSLAHVRLGVRHHHERFDGQGYPDRLAGKDIPLAARILAVADACDAMLSARSYRGALPTEQVEAALRAGAGTQWDPEIVACFQACRQDLYAVCQTGLGQSMHAAVEDLIRRGQDD